MRAIPSFQQTPAPSAPGAPSAAPAVAAQADFLSLQNEASTLSLNLAGMHARRDAMLDQLSSTTGPTHASLQQAVSALDVEIAEGEARLDNLRSQIAQRSQVPESRVSPSGTVLVPPQHQSLVDRMDPDAITATSVLLILTVLLPISIAVARRIAKGGKHVVVSPTLDELAPKVDRLEHAVDAIAIEIERISESQRFMTKVMAERSADASNTANGAAALPAGAPAVRALGAGAAEPVRAAERDAMRVKLS